MTEVILTIIIIVLIGSSLYREKIDKEKYEIIIEKILKQAEVDKYNLVAALKSYTTEDYTNSAVYPDTIKEEEKQEEESPFQDLDQLALEDPDEFDKVIGI